jgi:hypothetical protein
MLYVSSILLVTSCRREATPPADQPATQTQAVTTGTVAAPPVDLSQTEVEKLIKPAEEKLFLEKARIGPTVGEDGAVNTDSLEFKASQPFYLTMWLKESPDGLQTSAHLFDAKDKEVLVERKEPKGAKVVTFKLAGKKLKPGDYRAVAYWGGNIAAEYKVKLTK